MPTEIKEPVNLYDMTDPGDDSFAAAVETPAIETAPEPEVEAQPGVAEVPETHSVETPAVEVPAFEDSLIELAARQGFSADEAKAFGNSDNLRTALATLDSKAIAWAERQFTGHSQDQPSTPAAPAQPAADAGSIEELKLDLDPAVYDADTIKTLNSIKSHYDSAVRKLSTETAEAKAKATQIESMFNQITGHVQAEAATRQERELDTFFESLGDEFKPVYGNGPIRSLNPNGTELRQRQGFARNMELLKLADAHNNQPPLSEAAMRERVLAFMNSGLIKTSVRKEIQGEIEKRRKQAVARPSTRQSAPVTGEQKALQRVREFSLNHPANYDQDTPDEI